MTAPPSHTDALDYGRFEYLAEAFDVLASLAVSAREAAWRHNASLLEIHANEEIGQ
jgi:hypothetical protein